MEGLGLDGLICTTRVRHTAEVVGKAKRVNDGRGWKDRSLSEASDNTNTQEKQKGFLSRVFSRGDKNQNAGDGDPDPASGLHTKLQSDGPWKKLDVFHEALRFFGKEGEFAAVKEKL